MWLLVAKYCSTLLVLPEGTTLLGRGTIGLEVTAKKCSRVQAEMIVHGQNVTLVRKEERKIALAESIDLHDGDAFTLLQNDYTFEIVWLEDGQNEQPAKKAKPDIDLYNENVATKPIPKLGKVVLPQSSDDLILQETPKREEVPWPVPNKQPKKEKAKVATPKKEGPLLQWMRRPSQGSGDDNPFDVPAREEPKTRADKAEKKEEGRKRKFVLQERSADLFSATDALAHCVSEDFVMSKGIAQQFRDRFGGVSQLRATGTKTGGCAFLKHQGRYVYYLVTKPKFSDKPSYESLEHSLTSLRHLMTEANVTELAIPRLGCGLDRLTWDKVKEVICRVFADSGVTITVYTI